MILSNFILLKEPCNSHGYFPEGQTQISISAHAS
uniref:Uncharacterized protein n=1 Tax=Arundo donax TaxID=35708 RepID=A0A0A9SL24_ARUDO